MGGILFPGVNMKPGGNVTKTQKKVLELAKRMHDVGVTGWDLTVLGIPHSAAEALFRKGFLSKDSDTNPNPTYRIRQQ